MKLIDGYYAKDQNGRIYWHEEMPVSRQYGWDSAKLILELSCIQIDGPWEDSLHKVEDGKIIKYRRLKKTRRYWLVMEKTAGIADGIEGITHILLKGSTMCFHVALTLGLLAIIR